MLLFRLDLGLQQMTVLKKSCSCSYNNAMSLPRKIFITREPPGASTCVVMLKAASSSCACRNSSMSCSPVTSGAPSHTTSSASWPLKKAMICSAVERRVMSPCSCTTPGIGAISCRSTGRRHKGNNSSLLARTRGQSTNQQRSSEDCRRERHSAFSRDIATMIQGQRTGLKSTPKNERTRQGNSQIAHQSLEKLHPKYGTARPLVKA